jgi:hypothetical protein
MAAGDFSVHDRPAPKRHLEYPQKVALLVWKPTFALGWTTEGRSFGAQRIYSKFHKDFGRRKTE